MKIFLNRLSLSRQIIILMAILCIIGSFNVFSSGMILSLKDYNTPYHFVLSHVASLIVGILVCLFMTKVDYHYFNNGKTLAVIVLIIIGLLIAVKLFGITVNNSKRWIKIGLTFQPSELAKIVAILLGAYGATFIRRTNYVLSLRNVRSNWSMVGKALWPLAVLFVIFWMVETQPDFGTAAIIFGLGLVQYWIGARLNFIKSMLWMLAAAIPLGIGYYLVSPENFIYRFNRLNVWWDPWGDKLGHGYQTVQSMIAIGSGGFWGLGSANGYSKFGLLPEAHTDFAVAIYAQEHGFIGILFLGAIILGLLLTLTKAALKTRDYFGKMIIVGGLLLIVGQAVLNMAMVCGLLPVVGVPFPFISYGGTSLMLNFITLGLILSVVFRDEQRERDRQRKARELAKRQENALHIEKLRQSLYS